MDAILSILVLLASVLLIFVVYIQNPKGGGLSSDFGSPGQLGGVKKTNEFIDKLTWSLAGIIVVASIIIRIINYAKVHGRMSMPILHHTTVAL